MWDFDKIEFRIERYGEVTSTNDIVRERHLVGEAPGLVVVGDAQTKGRGRHGRQWSSPKGNLYCSLGLRPSVSSAVLPSLSLVVALTLAETIGQRTSLKWPNDVLIDGAKIAGILLEYDAGSVIVGMGVNIVSFPTQTPYPASCLSTKGLACSPELLLAGFLDRLRIDYENWQSAGFAPFRRRWLARGPQPGEILTLRQGEAFEKASFVDIADDGALIVERNRTKSRLTSAELMPPRVG